jgi:hypothetical protein
LTSLIEPFKVQNLDIEVAYVADQFVGKETLYTHIIKRDIHPNQKGYEAMAKVFAESIWGFYHDPNIGDPPAFALDEAELDAQAKFDALAEAGIFEGYGDGSAGLEDSMTRGQLAVVLARLLGHDDKQTTTTKPFPDVAAGHWAKPYVGYAEANGLIEARADYTAEATRADLVGASVITSLEAEVSTFLPDWKSLENKDLNGEKSTKYQQIRYN